MFEKSDDRKKNLKWSDTNQGKEEEEEKKLLCRFVRSF